MLKKGELVTLLGANGAGKSTLLKALSGIQRPREGRILLGNEEIQKLPPHQIVKTRESFKFPKEENSSPTYRP